jgi:hypothetical protein
MAIFAGDALGAITT